MPDATPTRPVTVSVPAQRSGDADVLLAEPDLPAAPSAGRWRRRAPRAAVGAVVVALLAPQLIGSLDGSGPSPSTPAPEPAEPVALSLLTPAPSAAPVRRHDGAGFTTLRLRVALRNDSASWVSVRDASLGPYHATGDGLGALAPGALTSLPLERLAVCGRPGAAVAPRFLELDVVGGGGPAQVYLGLPRTAAIEPSDALPDCGA